MPPTLDTLRQQSCLGLVFELILQARSTPIRPENRVKRIAAVEINGSNPLPTTYH